MDVIRWRSPGAIVEAEDTRSAFAARSDRRYPVRLPYVIAETEKGLASRRGDQCRPQPAAERQSARGCAGTRGLQRRAAALFVPERTETRSCLANHGQSQRSRESEHPMAPAIQRALICRCRPGRQPEYRAAPCPHWTVGSWSWCRQIHSCASGSAIPMNWPATRWGHAGAAQTPRQRARTRRPGIDGWLGGHRTQ